MHLRRLYFFKNTKEISSNVAPNDQETQNVGSNGTNNGTISVFEIHITKH